MEGRLVLVHLLCRDAILLPVENLVVSSSPDNGLSLCRFIYRFLVAMGSIRFPRLLLLPPFLFVCLSIRYEDAVRKHLASLWRITGHRTGYAAEPPVVVTRGADDALWSR